jgi:hypothetical protein
VTAFRGSVPEPLPRRVYIARHPIGWFLPHPVLVAHVLGCRRVPATSAASPHSGQEAHRLASVWCGDCFPGGRCQRRVVDSWGKSAGRCGQPTGDGIECRWHFDLDVAEDKRMERAA